MRPAFGSMLTNDNGPTFAWSQSFREQENAVSEDVRPERKQHFVTSPTHFVIDFTGLRSQRFRRRGQLAQNLFPEITAVVFRGLLPSLD